MASKFMASKFMANAAFEARLLLRPSHQRTVWTVNKLKCPIPDRPTLPPILSSRSYSDSTLTPPFPKSSGSTGSSQSSGPKKNKDPAYQLLGLSLLGIAALSTAGYFGLQLYKVYQRSVRESVIYDKLKTGPIFEDAIKHTIPRTAFVEEIRQVTIPAEESCLYPVIIGEHGTGKTSLIKLAVDNMNKPKGIVYVNIPRKCDLEVDVAEAIQIALGWSPDEVIDSSNPTSLEEVLRVLSHHAIKYKQEYGKIPVLIIDNANRLVQKQQELLNQLQDYAKDTADIGTISVVFMSSEGRVLRPMMQRGSWSRSGPIIEIGDVSKEEALDYLKLREIDEKQAAQIHELVGGRMMHLKSMADEIKRNQTFEAIRQKMFSQAEEQLESAKILPKHRYHKEGAAILRELLKKGSISRSTLYDLVGVDIGNKFLETNIFAFHFNSREITFRSTVMKRYCEENSASWEGK